MAAGNLCRLTITELSRLLAQREISAVDVVRAHLAQIDALEPRLNCFITLCRESALAEAQAVIQIVRKKPGQRMVGFCGFRPIADKLTITAFVKELIFPREG